MIINEYSISVRDAENILVDIILLKLVFVASFTDYAKSKNHLQPWILPRIEVEFKVEFSRCRIMYSAVNLI